MAIVVLSIKGLYDMTGIYCPECGMEFSGEWCDEYIEDQGFPANTMAECDKCGIRLSIDFTPEDDSHSSQYTVTAKGVCHA